MKLVEFIIDKIIQISGKDMIVAAFFETSLRSIVESQFICLAYFFIAFGYVCFYGNGCTTEL